MASGSVRSDCALDSKLMDFSVFQTEEFFFFVFWLSFPTHPSCKQVLRQAGPRLRVSQERKNGKREADPDSPEREGKDVCFLNECPGSQPPFPLQNPDNGLKYWKIFFFFKGN